MFPRHRASNMVFDVRGRLFILQKKEFVEVKKRTKEEVDEQDAAFDFVDFRAGADRLGWLVTYSAITVSDSETGAELSGENERNEFSSVSGCFVCEPGYFLNSITLFLRQCGYRQVSNIILSSRMVISSRRY